MIFGCWVYVQGYWSRRDNLPSQVAPVAHEFVFFLREPYVDHDVNHGGRVKMHRVKRLHIDSVNGQYTT